MKHTVVRELERVRRQQEAEARRKPRTVRPSSTVYVSRIGGVVDASKSGFRTNPFGAL